MMTALTFGLDDGDDEVVRAALAGRMYGLTATPTLTTLLARLLRERMDALQRCCTHTVSLAGAIKLPRIHDGLEPTNTPYLLTKHTLFHAHAECQRATHAAHCPFPFTLSLPH